MMKNETLAIILIKMCICNLSNRTLNNVEVIFFNIDSYGVREVITITEEISSILKLENTFWGRIIVNIELIKGNFGKGKLILFKIYY